MGWTSFPKADKTPRAIIVDELTSHDGKEQVLAITNSGGVAYVALRTRKGDVVGIVVLNRTSRGEFSYKISDESMGPVDANCPKKILDMLTPTNNAYALEWRERCRDNLAKPKLKPGMTFSFKEPLRFSDGHVADRFVLVSRTTVRSALNGRLYRIPRLAGRAYSVVV